MKKRYLLWGLLFLMSVFFGYCLGNLDFLGFFDGRHESNLILLAGSFLTSYFITLIAMFVFRVENGHPSTIFALASVFFVVMFTLSKGHILASIMAGILFIGFVSIISKETEKRLELFVKFVPSELFFPVVKKGFLFILVMFALINFFQSQYLLKANSLISPALIRSVSRPVVVMFNRQLETQLRNQLGDSLGPTENTAAKKQVVEYVLRSTIKSTFGEGGARLGIDSKTAPVDKVVIYNDGGIDVAPVINAMSYDLSISLNNWLAPYIILVPFVIAIATILILQPLLWPIEIIETILSRFIFYVLIKLRWIKIIKESREVERISL